jgi:hypothetical protein
MAAMTLKSPMNVGIHPAGIYSDLSVDGPVIGTLVIVVDRAKNLPNKKSMGKQDPYCAARLGKEAKKTNVDKRGGQTPRWYVLCNLLGQTNKPGTKSFALLYMTLPTTTHSKYHASMKTKRLNSLERVMLTCATSSNRAEDRQTNGLACVAETSTPARFELR